jgi:Zn-dependent M28 family amino/carboxypeptidase
MLVFVARWFLRGVALFVVVFGAIVAVVLAAGDDDAPAPPEPPPARAPLLTLDGHLRALQRIASDNGGNRAAGSAGERATVAYIERRLRASGYRVTRQDFEVPFFREGDAPRLAVAGERYADVRTLQFSAGGRAVGALRAVGLGCASADFAALKAGEVALAQRGTCTFRAKARNAERAGAAALLISNSGDAPVPGSLQRPGVAIPVLGIGAGDGAQLAARVGAPAALTVDAVSESRRSSNVIAEDGPRGAARVVMAGAHLDSVAAGPGLNDNGSGVAALLHAAERLGPRDLPLRLGFWGAEEIGLVGSRRYVDGLTAAERRRIGAYLNLDMVGSPDAEPAVYGSPRIVAVLRRTLGPVPRRELGRGSDHAAFQAAGLPVGGIFTGVDECYHQRCDTLRNVDREVLTKSARAVRNALLELAR